MASPAQSDDRIYPVGSREVTPPKVIHSVQPQAADSNQPKPAAGPKSEADGQKQAQAPADQKPEAADEKPQSAATGSESKTEPDKEKSGKDGKKKKTHLAGVAVISGYVGKDGRFHDPRIVRSAGKDLDPKAIQVLSDWRFNPCTRKGVPVNCAMAIEITFNLY